MLIQYVSTRSYLLFVVVKSNYTRIKSWSSCSQTHLHINTNDLINVLNRVNWFFQHLLYHFPCLMHFLFTRNIYIYICTCTCIKDYLSDIKLYSLFEKWDSFERESRLINSNKSVKMWQSLIFNFVGGHSNTSEQMTTIMWLDKAFAISIISLLSTTIWWNQCWRLSTFLLIIQSGIITI